MHNFETFRWRNNFHAICFQEANYKRDAIKKLASRRNRIARNKNHKSSNCFTGDEGGNSVCEGASHKKRCRIHGKRVKVIRSKHHRRSKSAPYKLNAAVNKDQLRENQVRKSRHLGKHRKISSTNAERLNSISGGHSCECVDGSLVDERRSRRYLALGQDQRFEYVQQPKSKVRMPINLVPRRSAQKSCHLHRVRSNHKRASRWVVTNKQNKHCNPIWSNYAQLIPSDF